MAVSARTTERRRVRARVAGVVQGVGFRPYVFRLAELGLGGWVLNDERGVEVEVEGKPAGRRVPGKAPRRGAAARERRIGPRRRRAGEWGAHVPDRRVGARAEPEALVSADFATCPDCLTELFDPADRRHRYPFINCTNCGPRFTIVRGVPYDRPLTTMAGFAMCEGCRAEYEDPRDRRFHAQPNACPECGPRVRLLDPDGAELAPARYRDPVAAAAAMLAAGKVVASKGSAATTSRAGPTTRPRSRAALAQAPRGQALRAHVRRPRRSPGLVELTAHEEEAPRRAGATDRDRATPSWAEVASVSRPTRPTSG